jgi:hypothetical protein
LSLPVAPAFAGRSQKETGYRDRPRNFFRYTRFNISTNWCGSVKGKAIEIAAKALQVGTGTIDRAMQVKKANPERFEQIKQGKIARGCEGLLRLDVVQDDRALLPRKPSCHASRSGSAGREAPRTDEAN